MIQRRPPKFRACVQEAGHSIIGMALKMGIDYAAVRTDQVDPFEGRARLGHVQFTDRTEVVPPELAVVCRVRDYLAILAGPVAEEICFGSAELAVGDYRSLDAMSDEIWDEHGCEPWRWRNAAAEAVGSYLRENLDDLMQVALALIEIEQLSGEQIEALLGHKMPTFPILSVLQVVEFWGARAKGRT